MPGPNTPAYDSAGRCGDPTCFCANWFDEPYHPRPAILPGTAVSQEFCEMWGEIALAHEAAVECRDPRQAWVSKKPAVGAHTEKREPKKAYPAKWWVRDEAYQVDAAAFERVIEASWRGVSNGAYTITATSPRMPQATAADFSNPNPRTHGISWSPEFALAQ